MTRDAEVAATRIAGPAGDRLLIHEIFRSLQGESTRAGRVCTFVRLTGCQMRCAWCDTEYAFHEGEWMSVDDVLARVAELGAALVEVTGGEPLLQPAAGPLMTRLCDAGYEVLLETGGGLDIAAVDSRVGRIVDIKCPASGEVENNRWQNLEHLRAGDELKFVLAGRDDYDWALRQIAERELVALGVPLLFSPVWGALDATELADWIARDCNPVRLNLQQHKILWGAATRGV